MLHCSLKGWKSYYSSEASELTNLVTAENFFRRNRRRRLFSTLWPPSRPRPRGRCRRCTFWPCSERGRTCAANQGSTWAAGLQFLTPMASPGSCRGCWRTRLVGGRRNLGSSWRWKMRPSFRMGLSFQTIRRGQGSSFGKESWIKDPREKCHWTDVSSIPGRGIGGRKNPSRTSKRRT